MDTFGLPERPKLNVHPTDPAGMVWFEPDQDRADKGETWWSVHQIMPDAACVRNPGNIKIKIPQHTKDNVERRLARSGRTLYATEQDASSMFRAIAFAVGRRREQSHVNIRNELVEFIKHCGDWPVLDQSDFYKYKPGCREEQNFLKNMCGKSSWAPYVLERLDQECPGNSMMLLAACCHFKTKICLITGKDGDEYEDGIWLAPPANWYSPSHISKTRLERSPIYIAHFDTCQFSAVQNQAQHARNEERGKRLSTQRSLIAEKMEREALEDEANEDAEAAYQALHPDDHKKLFEDVLLPPHKPGMPEPTGEMMYEDDKVQQAIDSMDGEELFNVLFEFKCVFDEFDYDSSGYLTLDEIVRAFAFLGVNLHDEKPPAEQGGYGTGANASMKVLKRRVGGHVSFAKFARILLVDRTTLNAGGDLKALLSQLPRVTNQDGVECVRAGDIDQLLSVFGTCDAFHHDHVVGGPDAEELLPVHQLLTAAVGARQPKTS